MGGGKHTYMQSNPPARPDYHLHGVISRDTVPLSVTLGVFHLIIQKQIYDAVNGREWGIFFSLF